MGSSPRGRGGLVVVAADRGRRGLIPARAGRSERRSRPGPGRAAHPRAGGAVNQTPSPPDFPAGSSPRGRGGHYLQLMSSGGKGLIPARAGRSVLPGEFDGLSGAHPRAGGAVIPPPADWTADQGSSPRGRGGQPSYLAMSSRNGLIPARAGRSIARPCAAGAPRAHPRAGGAVPRSTGAAPRASGSSPRGRGGPPAERRVRQIPGLIPARAGRSNTNTSSKWSERAHPRAGGAVMSTSSFASSPGGSSPRGRGGHGPPIYGGRCKGLIPARAGRSGRLHGNVRQDGGSSPRGRGGHRADRAATG